jgi:2-amino-4-hydroxy-6-hydroxymethyldihydropteridine diphosphokinase
VFHATELLDARDDVNVARLSTLVESEAVDVVDQPDFVNAVALVRTELDPSGLLDRLFSIEAAMGRVRAGATPRGPRPIDLDILLWGGRVIASSGLQVPHPRMHERSFVLLPMVELAPLAVHPESGRTMQELLAADIAAHGPVEDRCRVLSRGSLDQGSGMHGPAMKEAK